MVQDLRVTKYRSSLFAGLLLETALVLLDVTCGRMHHEQMTGKGGRAEIRTTDFLLAISSDGTEDGILLTDQSVRASVDVVLSTGRVALGLTGSVLFTAGLLPGGSSCEIANRLNDGTLDGVELAGGLTGKGSAEGEGERGGVGESVLGLSRRVVGRHCHEGERDVLSERIYLWVFMLQTWWRVMSWA